MLLLLLENMTVCLMNLILTSRIFSKPRVISMLRIPEIFLALAEVGDTLSTTITLHGLKSGKLPEMGKIIPYMENHLAFDDNSDL